MKQRRYALPPPARTRCGNDPRYLHVDLGQRPDNCQYTLQDQLAMFLENGIMLCKSDKPLFKVVNMTHPLRLIAAQTATDEQPDTQFTL